MKDKKKNVNPDQKKSEADLDETPKDNPNEKQNEENNAEEKPFDFGGIPDRNLKKNLGCG